MRSRIRLVAVAAALLFGAAACGSVAAETHTGAGHPGQHTTSVTSSTGSSSDPGPRVKRF